MITQQLKTVLTESFERVHQDIKVKQKHKKKESGQKNGRICPEWRRARSRVAARSRREKESQLFREIAALLPLSPNVEAQLDKASVIRITIAYLHLRTLLDTQKSEPVYSSQVESVKLNEKWFLDCALGGFLLLLTLNGKIIFATKDVTTHTGINQVDLIGRSLFDFIHPSDQKEIKEILVEQIGSQEQQKCEVFIRIKGTANTRLTPWKVMFCTGVVKSSFPPGSGGLLLLCRSLPALEVIEVQAHLNFNTFMSFHGLDMGFTYCHSGVLELTGFSHTELYGQSIYRFCHPSDCQRILEAHTCLLSKGQVHTGKYRLLRKHGGFIWAETDAVVVYNIHTGEPESVACINYILRFLFYCNGAGAVTRVPNGASTGTSAVEKRPLVLSCIPGQAPALAAVDKSGVELPGVIMSLEQTERLIKPYDSRRAETHSIAATSHHGTNHETSTTAHQLTSPVLQNAMRVRTANGHTEIWQKAAVCDSLTCEICAMDLDSLAPYIPMDGEDFLLTPLLDGSVDSSESSKFRPSFSELQLMLEPDTFPPLETVFPVTNDVLPALQHTDSYFSRSNRVNKGPELNTPRQWHDSLHAVHRKHHVETSCQIPKTNYWRTNTEKTSQHLNKTFWKNSESGLWDPKCAKLPWRPPQNSGEQQFQTAVNLPALSGWEHEMNVPLVPTSYMLQGAELTSILDQVALGVSWN